MAKYPDNMMVQPHPQTGGVKITFGFDATGDQSVELSQLQAQQLLAELGGKIGHGSLTPISLSRLRPGVPIQQESVSFRRLPTGSIQATFGVRFEDRYVTLTFDLNEGALADLDRERG